MNINAKMKDGKLEIDFISLLDQMDEASKLELADSLSIEQCIIKNVVDQITEGSTDMGSWGWRDEDAAEPRHPLSKFRRQIALAANEIAREKIHDLERALKKAADEHRKADAWAWKLWHHIGDKYNGAPDRPQPPKYNPNYSDEVKVVFVNKELS